MEIEQVCRQHSVRRLELFGSAAVGSDDAATSDLDFLVEFKPMPRGSYADSYFGLLESLERILERRVDLVVSSAIRNPYFRQSVESTKKLLYAA